MSQVNYYNFLIVARSNKNVSHILQKSNCLQYLVQPPPILAPRYNTNPPQNDAGTDMPLVCPSVPDRLADMYPPITAPAM